LSEQANKTGVTKYENNKFMLYYFCNDIRVLIACMVIQINYWRLNSVRVGN